METNSGSHESTEESQHSNENSQDSGDASKKSEENSASPLPSNLNLIQVDELDNETIKKMKGDAIGDTLYSERFVLKALMELKEQNGNKIDESFEKVKLMKIEGFQ